MRNVKKYVKLKDTVLYIVQFLSSLPTHMLHMGRLSKPQAKLTVLDIDLIFLYRQNVEKIKGNMKKIIDSKESA